MVWERGVAMDSRDHTILQMMSYGGSNRDIAEALQLSEGRVGQVLSQLYRRLGVGSRVTATAWYVRRYG